MSIPILHTNEVGFKLVSNGDNVVTISDFEVANVADRVLVIGIQVNSVAAGTPAVVSAAFGAAALSYIAAIDSGDARCEVWKLIAPAVSTDDITVTITDPPGAITRATVIDAALWKTANQTEPFVEARKQLLSGGADPSAYVVSMDEEIVCLWVSAQKDHPLNPNPDQVEMADVTQPGDTGEETIRGRTAYRIGQPATLVGYSGTGGLDREFAMIALPLCGPDVALIGRGTTDVSGTASMSRQVPLVIDLVSSVEMLANLGAKNWLQAFLSCEVTLTAQMQRAKLLEADIQATTTLGSRVGTGPRLFVEKDPSTLQITKAFSVDLALHGVIETQITFQELEHGVWITATIKVNGTVRDLTGATVFLYMTDNPNSPFPMGIEDGAAGKALYIAGRGDFAVGANEAQVDVLFANGDQYRSPTITINIQQVVA